MPPKLLAGQTLWSWVLARSCHPVPDVGGAATTLLTVTDIDVVPVFPPLSVASTVRVCNPLKYWVVSQLTVYVGPRVTGGPRFVPSTWNCTLVTLSVPEEVVADADMATVTDTVAFVEGAVIETVGGLAGGVVAVGWAC